jgi:hypothetical protein
MKGRRERRKKGNVKLKKGKNRMLPLASPGLLQLLNRLLLLRATPTSLQTLLPHHKCRGNPPLVQSSTVQSVSVLYRVPVQAPLVPHLEDHPTDRLPFNHNHNLSSSSLKVYLSVLDRRGPCMVRDLFSCKVNYHPTWVLVSCHKGCRSSILWSTRRHCLLEALTVFQAQLEQVQLLSVLFNRSPVQDPPVSL